MLHIYVILNSVLKKIPIVFLNGSDYDYHFIIKEFTYLGANTEKYVTFTVEKEVKRIDKNGEQQKIYATLSLSNLVNNLSEGVYRIKCKFRHIDKKCEVFGTKYKYCDCFLKYRNFKDDLA